MAVSEIARSGLLIVNVDHAEGARCAKHRTLCRAGYEVVDAASGGDALARIEALRPALVLLDVQLPDIDGVEVCKTIKQRWPTTMVLQTTASTIDAADRVRGLEGGADAYLVQPIDADVLVASVRALMRLYEAEHATRRLNENLESRIAERTRDLRQANVRLIEQMAQRERAEAALVQAQKMEAVGQLTGSIAHDFNNILASMMGWIHLARRKTADADIGAMLDKALSAGERGKRLTLRLLAFSRSDALVTGAVDVRELVLGMREWLAQTVGSGIMLEIEAAEGPLVAVTEANQLELALLNLMINARDAMPGGGRILVSVAARRLERADDDLVAADYVVVSVHDTGVGMAPEVMAKAFDPFFTTKPVGRGTGLGLAQVANVARLSAGVARIESRLHEGTIVTLWLAAGDPAAVRQRDARIAPANLAGSGERVLVVDDEADIRGTITALLRFNGYEVDNAANGQDALHEVERELPDLVLLDQMLPDMSGIDVARRLRAEHPVLPIVFVSGHAEPDALRDAVPGVRLLRKPFQSEELYAEVRRNLDLRRAAPK
jgi:DNA-binding response OmpR family regulator